MTRVPCSFLFRALLAFVAIIATSELIPAEMPSLAFPQNGARTLQLLSPSILELTAIVAGAPDAPGDKTPTPPPAMAPFAPSDFAITVGGKPVSAVEIGFRRRVVYAPLKPRDLRIGNFIYVRLPAPVAENEMVELSYKGTVPWLAQTRATVKADPRRLSPALHVNQVGYAPDAPKIAMFGYFIGTLREIEMPEDTEFTIVDVRSGKAEFTGKFTHRPDRGAPYPWYRKVSEADFSALKTPGEYQLVVPGLGASFPFLIHEGLAAAYARAYALGLYHQRCGAANVLPFTRFVHDACHTAPVEVPASNLRKLLGFDETPPDADLYPFVRHGKFDASGGHHDAGDYSKYTINSAGLVHHLVFAVDAMAGVAALDNLGLPESGDGKSDVLQEAKWEADFLAKLQDDDGGFYFLVYPQKRRYEQDVLPDKGDPQIVWPKNTAATAAAVAALAQCAGSPKFRELYPDAAKRYLEVARRGWKFLQAAEQKFGRGETYRKFTHYGDEFQDADEIAWAACELFLATGEAEFDRELHARLDPRDPKNRKWGWRRLTEGYGRAIRSYAFAARSGRLPKEKLDRLMLTRCEDEVVACADDWLKAAKDSAYGTSYPEATKRVGGGGWYFSSDQAFDLAVAANLDFPEKADRRPAFRDAVWSNLAYDSGTNPVNVCFITGLGWKRPLEIVHQYAQNDRRTLPPSGIPLGSIVDGFSWVANYKGELGALSYPLDGAKDFPYPILDRWGDAFNLQSEFVVVNQGRALATAAWLMAQTPLRDQAWKSAAGQIQGVPASVSAGQSIKVRLQAEGLDLHDARIVWEAKGHTPAFGHEFVFKPAQPGPQWIEAEAQLPDGRRVFAVVDLSVR